MPKNKFNLMDTLNAVSRDKAETSNADTKVGADIFKSQMISVHNLVPSKNNFYDTSDVSDLKQSIELFGGIKQNLIVKTGDTGKYEIISGHRRRKACLELVAEGKTQFEFVPCIIEDGKDPLIEQLLLIMTNSTARILSDREKCRQAEQLKSILSELKRRDGIPGRVRELVAQALGVSETQVARYNAINENLTDEAKTEFENGKVPVSFAYEVSRKPKEIQSAAVDEYKAAKEKPQESKPTENKPKIKLIYICSEYRGMPPYSLEKSELNLKKAAEYCKQIINEGNVPIAPHLFYQTVLDDTDEESREKGLALAAALIALCDEIWVFGDNRSEGMNKDLSVAFKFGIPIMKK